MPRGSLDHTEEMLYKQSKESLGNGINGVYQGGSFHHNTAWESDDLYTGESKSSSSFSFKVFVFSLLVCIFAGAFLFYKLTISPVTIDSKKIAITLTADPYVDGGQEEKLSVTVTNNNQITLDEAKLTFTYNKGSNLSGDAEKITVTKDIGQIPIMGIVKQEFPFILYGPLEDKRPLTVRLDYKIKGSNALFPKESSTEVTLSTPPLSLAIEGSENVVSGDQTEYVIVIKNNTATSSTPSFLSLTPPAGFSLIKTSENPLEKTFSWILPAFTSGEEKRIKITGVFTGVVGEKAVFKGVIGSKKSNEDAILDLYSFDVKDVTYSKPGLSASLTLVTDRGVSAILRKGDKISTTIKYKNEGISKISYIEYRLVLPDGIDPRTILVNQSGYYDSGTHAIIWSSEAYEGFLSLGVGQEGFLSMSFILPTNFKDTSLPIEIKYKGMDAGVGKVITSAKDFSYQIGGSVAFNTYTIYKDETSPNKGPLPPKVDTETTYTAVLVLSSETDLHNARVSFTLPALYVTWLDSVISSSTVIYDSRSKIVSWNVGDVKKDEKLTARIKLSVKPSLVHLGSSPQLSSKIVFSAEDIMTKEKIQQILDPLTTSIIGADNLSDQIHVIK